MMLDMRKITGIALAAALAVPAAYAGEHDGTWELTPREEMGVATGYRDDPSAAKSGRIDQSVLEDLLNHFFATEEGRALRQMMGPMVPERIRAAELMGEIPTRVQLEERELNAEGRRMIVIRERTRHGMKSHYITMNEDGEGSVIIHRTQKRTAPGTACAGQVIGLLNVRFTGADTMVAGLDYRLKLESVPSENPFAFSCESILNTVKLMSEQPHEDGSDNGLDVLLSEFERREIVDRSKMRDLETITIKLDLDGRKRD